MKNYICKSEYSGFGFLELLNGVNILNGIIPTIKNKKGKMLKSQLENKPAEISIITNTSNPTRRADRNHIDIHEPECTVIYDMQKHWKVDRIYIGGFFNGISDYSLSDYEIYLSDNPQKLLTDENKVAEYKSDGAFKKGSRRNNCDQIYDLEGFGGRYFAVKINKANPTDDIIRICSLAVFNHENTFNKTFYEKNFGTNILKDAISEITGDVSCNSTLLTDGICFDEAHRIALKSNTSFVFRLKKTVEITDIAIVCSKEAAEKCKCYIGDGKNTVFNNCINDIASVAIKPACADSFSAHFKFPNSCLGKYIGFSFPSGCFIDQLGCVGTYKVDVELGNVLCSDFMSFGANCLPMALMPEAVEKGYNEVYWELERSRIINTRPSVLRLWFQPDWLITTRGNYENGIYDFESTKMQSVYHYLDAFKTAGCEIELNFGWKTCKEHADWFAVNKQSESPWNSAPADLESFAKCCSATLNELILNRGYNNIKYLAFYNESNYGKNPTGDFNVPDGKPWPYYKKMFLIVMKQLKKDGIEDEIAGEYSMVMYTTITPKKQVAFEKAMHTVSPGEQIVLGAKLVDTDENDSLTYQITKATGESIGKVDENGVYTADKKANVGDMVAVTASLYGHEDIFGVTLIKIK